MSFLKIALLLCAVLALTLVMWGFANPQKPPVVVTGRRLLSRKNVNTGALSEDGSRVALASAPGIELIDLQYPDRGKKIEPPGLLTLGMTWSPDRTRLAAYAVPGGVGVYDVNSVQRLWGQKDAGPSAWSPDGSQLAVWDMNRKTAMLLDTDTWQVKRTVKDAFWLIWSPDGTRALGLYPLKGYPGQAFQIVNSTTWIPVTQVTKSLNTVHVFAWSPNGKLIAFGGTFPDLQFGPNASLVDTGSGRMVRGLRQYDSEVRAIAWSPDSRQVAITYATRESDRAVDVVNIHDVATGRVLYRLEGPSMMIVDLKWDSRNRWIRAAATNGDSQGDVWEWVLPATAAPSSHP